MSLASGTIKNPAIDDLVQSSLEGENEDLRLKWIPYEEIGDIKPTQVNNIYYAVHNIYMIILVFLGSSGACTPTLVSEFARMYSLPTHKYNDYVSQYKRCSVWLKARNKLIKGFTEYNGNYYMVADRRFYHGYSLYGFCSKCQILRCSPVWCICGHKQLSNGWTSNNKQLDEFIKKSQLQTNSPNDPYLEWILYDCINEWEYLDGNLCGLPTSADIDLIPLKITDETPDLYYAEVNYLLMRHLLNSSNSY